MRFRLRPDWSGRRWLRRVAFLAIALVSAGLGSALYIADPLHTLELSTVDLRFSLRGAQRPPSNLVVVAITDETFTRLGLQWPFPRRTHARVITNLVRDGARAIGYDVAFPDHSHYGVNDDIALANAINNAPGKVVLATEDVGSHGKIELFGVALNPASIHARGGNVQFANDSDGKIRHMLYSLFGLDSFGVATAEVASGHHIPKQSDSAWIDYYGPPGSVRTIDFADVYTNHVPRGLFRNAIVVVGATSPSLHDFAQTPFSHGANMAGAEIQANAIETALRGFPLRDVASWLDVLIVVAAGCIVPLASIRLSLILTVVVALISGAALFFGSWVAFDAGRVVTFVYPITALAGSTVASIGGHYLLRAFEQLRVQDLFARFVPGDVVREVIARTDDDLRIGGVRQDGTVMFTDLRGFTSFAERLEPERVVEVINHYLTEMSDAILNQGGTLVAYMGDGIMALFGAPLPQDDHADRGLRTARDMLEVRLPRFNAWLVAQGYQHEFRMGIALNSGPVLSGNVGSPRRLEYTALGDTTNTSSRLEAMTKGTPHQLFVSESTRDRLREIPADLVYVDEVEVRGRQAAVKLWTLAPPADGGERLAAHATDDSDVAGAARE
jgi:adenylate cyclase